MQAAALTACFNTIKGEGMKPLAIFFCILIKIFVLATPAIAQAKLDGTFVASENCAAYQSIKKKTNRGSVSTSVGKSYEIIAQNKTPPTHYQIRIEGAVPSARWVAITCGAVAGQKAVSTEPESKVKTGEAFYVLAISWQPAFCESKPNKVECKNQSATRYDASNFTLHGLWPQPRSNVFCNVPKSQISADDSRLWEQLPPVQLKPETRRALDEIMPGTQSYLDRHEWIKHGTCFPGGDQEAYYHQSVRIMQAINGSALQKLFADNIGREVSAKEIRTKFDETFGVGASQRIRIACARDGNRTLISELTIGLKGDVSDRSSVKDLILASSPTDMGCPSGIIDDVGLQ